MRASKYIEALQKLIEQYGDQDLIIRETDPVEKWSELREHLPMPHKENIEDEVVFIIDLMV